MIVRKIQESCIHLFLIIRLVNYYIFLLKVLYSLKTLNSELPYIQGWFTDQNAKLLTTKF